MALTIKDIIDKNLFEGTHLLAGRENAGNAVSWVNVMEILDSPDTIKKGELLITTGYNLTDYEAHRTLIARLKSRGVSGIMIQTGYYIDRIPEYILEAARQHQFPVLELPARYSFSEILHVLIDEITKASSTANRTYIDYEYFLNSIRQKLWDCQGLLRPGSEKAYLFCISPANLYTTEREQLFRAFEQIRSFLTARSCQCVYDISDAGQAVFCLSVSEGQEPQAVAYDLLIQLIFLSEREGINLYAGIDQIPEISSLPVAFKNAISCIYMLKNIEAKRGVCSYENYVFIKMFGFLYQNNRSFALENQALRVLLNKDRNSGTNYVHTVRIYLSENCNITRTAKRLFIHRHTLLNRIQAITELCGLHFDDYYTRLYLSMALLIHDYYAV